MINDFKNLYHYQNYYISAQPAYETLQWLHSRGVRIIINLRSEKENADFTQGAFNEANICKDMGFEYYSIPVDGTKDYTPAKLDTLSVLLNKNDQILSPLCQRRQGLLTSLWLTLLKAKDTA